MLDGNKLALVEEWYVLSKKVEGYKADIERELELRKALQPVLFPDPKEGVNKDDLPDGFVLKLTHKVDRKVSEEELESIREPLAKLGVSLDTLVKVKHDLVVKEYKQLTEEQKKVVDTVLTTKPGSPTIEIVPPKEK